jgi:hypothetical protein
MASSKSNTKLTREEESALYGASESFRLQGFLGFDYVKAQDNWQIRNSQLQSIRLQPYNDLLFKHLTSTIDFHQCSAELLEKIKTATDPSDLCVPIWEFKHCHLHHDYRVDVESYGHVQAARAGVKDAVQAETINSRGFRGLVGATCVDDWYGDVDFTHPLVEIDRIFRKTDLKERLALHFGGIYLTVSLRQHYETETIDGEVYYPIRSEVMLNYYPRGVPEFKRKELGRAALKYKDYVSRVRRQDTLVLEDGSESILRRLAQLGEEGRI